MAKKTIPMNDEYEIDVSSPVAVMTKTPGSITNGLKPMSEYMEIPCDRLITFQNKKDSDFDPWPEEKFQALVDSVRSAGVLEAIVIRPAKDRVGTYEIIAGEHRWKASVAAGRKTIPARVLIKCDDEMAEMIFSATNILRRDNSIRDKINGWWHYVQMTKYKRESELDQLIQEGILSPDLHKKNLPMREIYRYAKLHDLMDDYISLIENKKLTVTGAFELSFLSLDQQADLLPYKLNIKNDKTSGPLHKLASGKLSKIDEDGNEVFLQWNKENIEAIIFPVAATQHASISDATRSAKEVIKLRVNKSYYGRAKEILDEALTLYFEKHPECENIPK